MHLVTGADRHRCRSAKRSKETTIILLVIAYLGGALTILSPCILPILPFVFARAGQPFLKSTLPMQLGIAVTFAAVATLAAVGGGWAVHANEYGRLAALALLTIFGLSLLSPRIVTSLAIALMAGGRVFTRMTQSLHLSERLRQGLGVAVIAGVGAIALGADTGLLARLSYASISAFEQTVLDQFHTRESSLVASDSVVMTDASSGQPFTNCLPVEGIATGLDGMIGGPSIAADSSTVPTRACKADSTGRRKIHWAGAVPRLRCAIGAPQRFPAIAPLWQQYHSRASNRSLFSQKGGRLSGMLESSRILSLTAMPRLSFT